MRTLLSLLFRAVCSREPLDIQAQSDPRKCQSRRAHTADTSGAVGSLGSITCFVGVTSNVALTLVLLLLPHGPWFSMVTQDFNPCVADMGKHTELGSRQRAVHRQSSLSYLI